MVPTLSEQLVALLRRPITVDDRASAALHLIDWLGCAAAGAASPPMRLARAAIPRRRSGAAIMGGGYASPLEAAFLNGIPGNVLEMDDVHRAAILHPGPTVIPAALAAAALRPDLPGPAFLDALVVGYEAVIRIGRALGPLHYARFHNTATAGPFGAVAAAGHILDLGDMALVSALGNAGTQAAGLWQCRHEPVMTKQLHCAHAAQAGFQAAMLASHGFTGPRSLLDGPQGFFAGFCPDGEPAKVIAGPDSGWLMHETSFKPWPACRHAHPVIDAARRALGGRRGPFDTAIVETYADAIRFCDKPHPTTPTEAKFSLQHAVAIVALKDKPTLADFEPDAIRDPAAGALRDRVVVREAPDFTGRYPARFGARVTIDGRPGEARDAWGDPEWPLVAEEVEAKARTLLAWAGVPPGTGSRVLAAAKALGEGGGVRDLAAAVAGCRIR